MTSNQHPTNLQFARTCRLLVLSTLLAFASNALNAQQKQAGPGTAMPMENSPGDDILTLSPFTVREGEVHGYRATSTLAGTRLNASLKDLAGAIQVATHEFLQDTGSNDAQRLLLYTTSTEVAGADGNFAGSTVGNNQVSDGSVTHSVQPTTRVRGMASADLTRDYFLTDIPFDTYNTEQVTVSRGPNSMLFGLGSPGGIIDNTLKEARFKDANSLEYAIGSYGATRSVLDLNRVLVPGKVALRVIGLHKEDKFMQEENFKREQRLYGNLVIKPFEHTIFRVNAEAGAMDSSVPRILTPKSAIADWVANGMPLASPGNILSLRSIADNRAPIYVYDEPDAIVPVTGFHVGIRSPQSATAVQLQSWDPRYAAMPAGSFFRTASMADADRWIFDYREHSLTGNLNRQSENFDAVNLSLEQTFLDNRAGIQFAYDSQKDNSSWNDRAANELKVDVSPYLPYTVYNPATGKNEQVPNPNVGRALVVMTSGLGETITDRSAWRITAFYDLDFKRETKKFGWLGRHVFTGMMSNQTFKTRLADTQYGDAQGLETKPITDGNTPGSNFKASSFDRAVTGIRYLGDITGYGASTVTGITADVPKLREFSAVMWNRNAPPNIPGELGAWQTRTISVIDNPITGASLNRSSVDSLALIGQSYLLNDNLVFTLGWRRDKSRNWFTNAPQLTTDGVVILNSLQLPDSPNDQVSGDTFSWGGVAHLPERWARKLGFGASIHYGLSENFQPLAGRVDIMNRPVANPQGNTKEMGFSLDLFESKLLLRFNWFETDSKNQTDNSLGKASIPNYERLVYNAVRTIFTGPGEANEHWADVYTLPPQGMMDAFWTPTNPNPAPGGTTSVADASNPNVTGTSDFSSKGMEIESTYNPTKNWSITFNVAKVEAIKTNVLQSYQDYLDIRKPQWAAMENLIARPQGTTVGQAFYGNAETLIAAERSKEGAILPEVRKWRFNIITSYRFSDGWLKGWATGGAVRWQDKCAVGYHSTLNEFGSTVIDVSNPIFGPSLLSTDLFVNYSREIMRNKMKWKVQLNVYNLLDDKNDIPVNIDDDLVVVGNRVQNGRTFMLTNTFEF